MILKALVGLLNNLSTKGRSLGWRSRMCMGHVMHTLRTLAVASRLLRILPQRLPFSLTTSTVYALNHVVAAMIRLKRLIHDNTSRWVWQSNIYPTIYESTQLKITNYSEWYPTWSSLTPVNIMINALFRGIFFSTVSDTQNWQLGDKHQNFFFRGSRSWPMTLKTHI